MEKRVLIARWLGSAPQPLPIYDEASVSSARERVRETGRQWSASRELVESVALIASELTHNHLAHAKQGYFAVRTIERQGIRGLEVIAADLGPGIEKPVVSDRKASPEGSLRAGLAAVFRIADEVDLDSRIAEGACIIARKFESPAGHSTAVAILGKPYPGEAISGDDGVFLESEAGFFAAVCDGLGHGPEAREASNRAVETAIQNPDLDLSEILLRIHKDMADTRGCATSLIRFRRETFEVECASAGDVQVQLYNRRDTHLFTSMPLILRGRELLKKKFRVETAPTEPGAVLVMFTDGLTTRTSLKGQLDLLRQPVAAIAQHLMDTQSRGTDDALVLVARFGK